MKMLTKHFSQREMACRCGCRSTSMDVDFMAKLEILRQVYGHALTITSGARCAIHNKVVGGSPRSFHLSDGKREANAADILVVTSKDRGLVVKAACELGFGGVGISGDFIHLDGRDSINNAPIIWIY